MVYQPLFSKVTQSALLILIDEAKMSGIGVGIRESNGAVLASFSQKIPLAYKAEEIEALAALNALSFAFELGFHSTILKGDSLGLTQAMKLEGIAYHQQVC